MANTPFGRQVEAETRHTLLLQRVLGLVVQIAPGLPGYYYAVQMVNADSIVIRSQFTDMEGTWLFTERIQLTYQIDRITGA